MPQRVNTLRLSDEYINWAIIGQDNGLLPGQRQAITWTNAGILLIGPLGTNFSEILIEIHTFSFKKMQLKMSSGKWQPFCLFGSFLGFRASAAIEMCSPWPLHPGCMWWIQTKQLTQRKNALGKAVNTRKWLTHCYIGSLMLWSVYNCHRVKCSHVIIWFLVINV